MNTKLICTVYFIMLIALATIYCSPVSPPCSQVAENEHVLAEEGLSLTWTSRWSPTPQSVANESEIVGDHVFINATFPESMNVTRTEISLLDGFTFATTRPLVDGWSGGIFPSGIDPDLYDWIQITGLKQGWPISFSMDFNNGDSDLYAWPSDIPMSSRTNANNVLSMASNDKPEKDNIIWTSDCETMDIGCYNYDNTPGNWTLNLIAGYLTETSTSGRTANLDTYLLNRNSTVDISVTGQTSTNDTLRYSWSNVTFGNYFKPLIFVNTPEDIGKSCYNVTWTSYDLNADDVNFYTVWFSIDGGVSYQILAPRLDEAWLCWNATGFLFSYDYIFKVRAYSVDLATLPDQFNLTPSEYFPGDYADGFSPSFQPSGIPSVTVTDIFLHPQYDLSYVFGSIGNTITWTLGFEEGWEDPESFTFYIYHNDDLFHEDIWHGGNMIVINVDALSVGIHDFRIEFQNPGSSGGNVIDSVTVYVYPLETTPPPFIRYGIIGVSIGSSIIFVIVIVLIFRLKREPAMF